MNRGGGNREYFIKAEEEDDDEGKDWSFLPVNVTMGVIKYLNSRSIGNMRLVCRTWHYLITNSITCLTLNKSYPNLVLTYLHLLI